MDEAGYKIAYFGIVFLGFLISVIINPRNEYGKDNWVAIVVCVILAVLMGCRPLDVGTDTMMYSYIFEKTDNLKLKDVFIETKFSHGPLFSLLFYICNKTANFALALTLVNFFTNIFYYIACRMLVKRRNLSAAMCFFAVLASFTCFNQEINVIRNGFAMALLMIFLIYLWRNNWKMMILVGTVGIFIHYSVGIFIPIALFVRYLSRIPLSVYVVIFFLILFMSYLGFSVLVFSAFTDIDFDKVQAYTQNVDAFDYVVGFRPLFALYNTAFLGVFLWFRNNKSSFQEYLIKLYIGFSIIFFLWFSIPFSDRIGAYSWMIIPILGFLLTSNKRLIHPSITLFMIFVCYWVTGIIIY